MKESVCTVEDCDIVAQLRRGYCPKHYQRWRKYGDPNETTDRFDLDARFNKYVERETRERVPGLGPCWIWRGLHAPNSAYGWMWVGRYIFAHRWAYERFVAPLDRAMHVHHRCEVKDCVNPAHLEMLTPADHRRSHRPPKTHCVHGHELVPENVRVNSQGCRICRTCDRERGRRENAKRRLSVRSQA